MVYSRRCTQQHDGVERFLGSGVGPQRHNKVVETRAAEVRGHYDSWVRPVVLFGVPVAAVGTFLVERVKRVRDSGDNNGLRVYCRTGQRSRDIK